MEWIAAIGAALVAIISFLIGRVRKQKQKLEDAEEAEAIAKIKGNIEKIASEVKDELVEKVISQHQGQKEIDADVKAKEQEIESASPEAQSGIYNNSVKTFNKGRNR